MATKKPASYEAPWNPKFGKTGHPLKTAADVERLKFTLGEDGNPVRIGGHHYGDVYLGKVHFKGERDLRNVKRRKGWTKRGVRRWHRVAIKRFHDPERKYYGGPAYQETIDQLRSHKVLLPKMAMILLPKGTRIGDEKLRHAEWVQVSQLYGSTKKGPKIHEKSWGKFPTADGREFAVRQLTEACSGGRNPSDDLLEPIDLKGGTHTIPFDIDELHYEPMADKRAMDLVEGIRVIAKAPFEGKKDGDAKAREEYRRLYDISIEVASPAMKKAVERAERRRMMDERGLSDLERRSNRVKGF